MSRIEIRTTIIVIIITTAINMQKCDNRNEIGLACKKKKS